MEELLDILAYLGFGYFVACYMIAPPDNLGEGKPFKHKEAIYQCKVIKDLKIEETK